MRVFKAGISDINKVNYMKYSILAMRSIQRLHIFRSTDILVRGIQSQLNLKPHFYSESAKVGALGCILGGSLAFYLFSLISSFFGVASDVPIREYEQTVIIGLFSSCLLTLLVCLYFFCAISALVYYGTKYKKGYISKEELINIAFKSLYPQRWQNGL
ncbi:hypothetical protein [Shewanella surugensis]|uniref:Uncharacterized protein n=1 Tax=Shewanella surugensis TaxID=212020 RepID=A0ABT0LDW2_9GAMM|nr:hypothetical protein [Shewanella surugensis]MCL1125878.1 hypothetical protein [Shewanella surugensis]